MTKKELRFNFKSKRNFLSSNQIQEYSLAIANRVLMIPIWQFSYFHLFLSIDKNKEVDTTPLLSILQGKDKEVLVPKIIGDGKMAHYLLTDNTVLIPNALGIPEPKNGLAVKEAMVDVVFVPLLAFDTMGNRVGYGKGFYDRFLNKCNPKVVKIGLSFFGPVSEISDVTTHDIPLDYCVTPDRLYSF